MRNQNVKRYEVKDIPCLWHGRLAKRDAPHLFFGGSGIEFSLYASECYLEMTANWTSSEETVRVTLDGFEVARVILMPGVTTLPVYYGLNPEVKRTVRLYKEHQAGGGEGQLLRVDAVLTDGRFDAPPARPFRMEVMGDSLTAAEGLGASASEKDWRPAIFGTRDHYAFLAAEALNADCRLYALSGWGVACDYNNNPHNVMPLYYDRVAGMFTGKSAVENGAQEAVDFEAFDADLVCINLGANDMGAFRNKPWIDPKDGREYKLESDENGRPTERGLSRLREAILFCFQVVRKCNPHARILWIYGMYSKNDDLEKTVRAAINEMGDEGIDFLTVPTMRPEDRGAHGHPGPRAHRAVAEAIIAYFKEHPLVQRARA